MSPGISFFLLAVPQSKPILSVDPIQVAVRSGAMAVFPSGPQAHRRDIL